ncbi:MAG TPA: polysaccharide deacetylase family protein [Bacillus bacterium]|nr:polysaccharide deacetylase family protein [Bacillus sp. (in: firmicutes)]
MLYTRTFLLIQTFLIMLVCSIGSGYSAQASTYPLQTKYPNTIIYKANTKEKVIALTFDDGPDNRFTPLILDILKKYDVKATFFLLGTRVRAYPDVTKRIYNDGHVIGNHTYWHPVLTNTGVKNMIWEIEKNEKEIMSIIGARTDLFRAPYGALDEKMLKQLENMEYRCIGWSVDSQDWKSLSSDDIKRNVLNAAHPGAIILMHSAGHWTQDLTGTANALNDLIPYLKKKGYVFVTIPELWSIEHA